MSNVDVDEDTTSQIQALESKLATWEALERRVQENIDAAPSVITLDVGGTLFKTSKATLLSVEDSYFHAMLGSGLWQPDGPNNTYFLDLDPTTFQYIMAYLRTGIFYADVLNPWEKAQLQCSVDYLNIPLAIPAADSAKEKFPEWKWDPATITAGMKLSEENRVVHALQAHFTRGYYQWMSVRGTLVNPTHFRVRIDSLSDDTFVGLAPVGNPQKNGYFLRLKNGQLRSPRGNIAGQYHPSGLKATDVLSVHYMDGNISFGKNGHDLGVAFKVEDQTVELYPSVLSYAAVKVTIISS
ncbi:hypothetical protein AC1031_002679 [Aphanomyces cochlioides]|nr:hypothetical protein AC1031_002679 [Aphanomyces cochlioides]